MNKPLSGAPHPEHQATQPLTGDGPTPAPVVNPAELQALSDHVGRPAAARFAFDFLNLLEDRIAHVDEALRLADPVSALNAVLLLKASSAMLGAEQMTLYCSDLEAELRELRIARAGSLPLLAADFTTDLTAVLEDEFPSDATGPMPAL
jgi:hypothetical protein